MSSSGSGSSDSESGSSSSSSSESDSDSGFKRNVTFKKPLPNISKEDTQDSNINEKIALSIINSNLANVKSTKTTLFNEEEIICEEIDDTDQIEDKELWKKRELSRLHRERNARIARENV